MLVVLYTLVAQYFTDRAASPATDVIWTPWPAAAGAVQIGHPERARPYDFHRPPRRGESLIRPPLAAYFGLLNSVWRSRPSTLDALRTDS